MENPRELQRARCEVFREDTRPKLGSYKRGDFVHCLRATQIFVWLQNRTLFGAFCSKKTFSQAGSNISGKFDFQDFVAKIAPKSVWGYRVGSRSDTTMVLGLLAFPEPPRTWTNGLVPFWTHQGF